MACAVPISVPAVTPASPRPSSGGSERRSRDPRICHNLPASLRLPMLKAECPPRALGHLGPEPLGVGLSDGPPARPAGRSSPVPALSASVRGGLWSAAQLLLQGPARARPSRTGHPPAGPTVHTAARALQTWLSPNTPGRLWIQSVQPTRSWALLRASTVAPCQASWGRITARARRPPGAQLLGSSSGRPPAGDS